MFVHTYVRLSLSSSGFMSSLDLSIYKGLIKLSYTYYYCCSDSFRDVQRVEMKCDLQVLFIIMKCFVL
jgi:hypothetical protein